MNKSLSEKLDHYLRTIKEEDAREEKLESIIRLSLSEEQMAVAAYLKRAAKFRKKAEEHPENAKFLLKIANTFADIAKEEKEHIGELEELLKLLGVSNKEEKEGAREVNDK